MTPEKLAAVRDQTDLVGLVQETVKLRPEVRSWSGECPFCKAPKFHVNSDRGFFHCFGCRESGSAIDFVMKRDKLGFKEAVARLEAALNASSRRSE
jgi:DNA primase